MLTAIGVIAASITTATLDWITAKVETYTIEVPVFTPAGIVQQEVEVTETTGGITGRKWQKNFK